MPSLFCKKMEPENDTLKSLHQSIKRGEPYTKRNVNWLRPLTNITERSSLQVTNDSRAALPT